MYSYTQPIVNSKGVFVGKARNRVYILEEKAAVKRLSQEVAHSGVFGESTAGNSI